MPRANLSLFGTVKEEHILKNRLFQGISTMLSCAVVISCMPVSYASGEAQPVMSGIFDSASETFSVSADLGGSGKRFVTVMIAPNTVTDFSSDGLTNDSIILKTAQTDVSGKVDFKIILPDGDKANRYNYSISADNDVRSAQFSTVVASSLTDYTAKINSGESGAAQSFVDADTVLRLTDGKDKDKSYIVTYINAAKPSGGYTDDELLDAYLVGEGLAYVRSGSMSLEDLIDSYTQYLPDGKDYAAAYGGLKADERKALENAFRNNAATDRFDAEYEKNLFIAKYNTADSAVDTKKLVTDYFSANDISMAAYTAITNSYYAEKVFDAMYASRESAKSIDDIKAAFDAQCAAQAAAAAAASSSQSGGSGGGGGSSKGGGTTGSIGLTPQPDRPQAAFTDMADHWAKDSVERMSALGIVKGYEDGSFRPEVSVTRAEFTKMIAAALALNDAAAMFDDVSGGDWYYGAVGAAANAGIVNGDGGRFDPERYITRQDAAVIVHRAIAYKGKNLEGSSFGFNDESAIAEYAAGAVNALAASGIVTGYNGGFAPNDNITRAEAATIVLRMVDFN